MRIHACAFAALLLVPSVARAKDVEVEIILDCSQSMLEKIEGSKRKIDIAKQCLHSLVDELPNEARVGLRAYSHRYPGTERDRSCKDTELLFPIGPLDKPAVHRKVDSLTCKGVTPIAYSLDVCANDFAKGDVARTIVLLSDGIETCGGDPVAIIGKLRARGFDVTIQVIGLGVDADAREDLERIARAGRGKYFSANGAAELAKGLKSAVVEALPEFGSKKVFFMNHVFSGLDADVLEEKGETVKIRDAKGEIHTVPAYLCVPREPLGKADFKVGAEVLALEDAYGLSRYVWVGSIIESKANRFTVATRKGDKVNVGADHLYKVPRAIDAAGLPATIAKAPNAATPALLKPYEAPLGDFRCSFPAGYTIKLDGGVREVRRVGLISTAWSDFAEYRPASIEVWAGASTIDGFWQPLGKVSDFPLLQNVVFFKFPPVKAEFIHFRITSSRTGRPDGSLHLDGLRVFGDDGPPGTLGLEKIVDPKPPTGEAGETEKKAEQVVIDEGDGKTYRVVKLLRKTGDKAIVIGSDGTKLTIEATKLHVLETPDLAKVQLGDDVLIHQGATEDKPNDRYARATVTEILAGKKLKVQLGPKEFIAPLEAVFRAPPEPAPAPATPPVTPATPPK